MGPTRNFTFGRFLILNVAQAICTQRVESSFALYSVFAIVQQYLVKNIPIRQAFKMTSASNYAFPSICPSNTSVSLPYKCTKKAHGVDATQWRWIDVTLPSIRRCVPSGYTFSLVLETIWILFMKKCSELLLQSFQRRN